MVKPEAAQQKEWSPTTVGAFVGGAFGISLTILLTLRATWITFLIAFSPVIGFAPLLALYVTAAAFGATLGANLGKANFVPSLAPVRTLTLAIVVAFAPLAAGFVEVGMRGAPFALSVDVETAQWSRTPSGEQMIHLESAEAVPVLHDSFVQSAKAAGWTCNNCQYQPTTETGHANFTNNDKQLGEPGGNLGFEIWPGEKALYGTAPSTLTQARITHRQRTWSVEWANLFMAALLLAGMMRYSETRPLD